MLRLPLAPLLSALLLVCFGVVGDGHASPDNSAVSDALDAGKSEFVFSGWQGPAITVWTYVPSQYSEQTPIVFIMHGTDRDADRYRDEWAALAEESGFVVVAPEFSKADFPGPEGYNLGNVVSAAGAAIPKEEWSFSAIEPIFDSVKARIESARDEYAIYGHSAGAQFVHRFVYFVPEARLSRAVAANAGWYTMPDGDTAFPYGLKTAPNTTDEINEALEQNLVILLGTNDTDPEHVHLRRTPEAMAQGAHRFARGHAFFKAGEARAQASGAAFGWRIEYAPGVGHSNGEMAAFAAPLLSEVDAPRPMMPIDFVEMPRLGSPALSPDGAKLLYLRSRIDWKENKIIDRYRLLDLETGATEGVVEPEDEGESFNRAYWKPDSSGFITTLEREDDDHEQAYFYSLADKSLTRLTEHHEDVKDVAWAPDGARFYFAARRRDPGEAEARQQDRGWKIREYETRSPDEIWSHDVDSGETEKVVAGDFYVRGYALSRRGDKVIHMRAPGGLIDDRHQGDLWVTDVVTGESARVTNNGYSESNAKLSPDNTMFAFIATVNENGEQYYEDNLFIQEIGVPEPTLLLPDMAIEIQDFAWDNDGKGLFILGNIGLRSELFHYVIGERRLDRLTQGDHALGDWTYLPEQDVHVAKIVDAQSPGELYIMRDRTAGFEQATDEYSAWSARFLLPKQEAVTWRGRGRQEIEGLLVYPTDYEEGERFPLVTITHGGPRSSSQFGSWNTSRFVPVLAGLGYGVLLPNHRGGTGYGDDFVRDMVGRYFNNAHHDVMDGIDAMIERGFADPDKLIKMGWSAGGHMTNKLITETIRFKAASSGAGASEWISMYGESDVRFNRTPWFGGAPWEERAPLRSYARQSILKDAWRVTTPTVFYVGGRDVRVPPTQSIMMYRGLKAADVETELYVAPNEPHGFRKPSHRLFKINTDLAWFARHALGEEYRGMLPNAAYEPEEEEKDE